MKREEYMKEALALAAMPVNIWRMRGRSSVSSPPC